MRSVAAIFALGLLVAACGGDEPVRPPTATPTPVPVPEAEPPPSPPPSTPPTGNLRGDAKSGASIYGTYCTTCHGADGKGKGQLATSLPVKPADHTDAEYMGSLSDEQLWTVIQKGGVGVGKSPLMAAWAGVLNDQDTRDVIAYLRKLSGT